MINYEIVIPTAVASVLIGTVIGAFANHFLSASREKKERLFKARLDAYQDLVVKLEEFDSQTNTPNFATDVLPYIERCRMLASKKTTDQLEVVWNLICDVQNQLKNKQPFQESAIKLVHDQALLILFMKKDLGLKMDKKKKEYLEGVDPKKKLDDIKKKQS